MQKSHRTYYFLFVLLFIPLSGADALSGHGHFRGLSRSPRTVCCSRLQWLSQVNIYLYLCIYK